MKKIKIGYLPLYVKLYDDYDSYARPRINEFSDEIKGILESKADVVYYDICRLEPDFEAAVALFEKENVDAIVTLHLAYSPSLESEKPLAKTKLPIVVLDTTPTWDFTYDNDPAVIMYNHGIHGVQDMCNLLVRNGKDFAVEAGHYTETDVIERVIKRVKGIKVASSLQNSKVGSIGGMFAGMGDFTVADGVFDKMGIKIVDWTAADTAKYISSVTDAEIDALIAEDKEKYDVADDIAEDYLRDSAKGSIAIQKWIKENGLTAFTANFLKVTKETGIYGMPFAEANRSMEKGIGFAGEGDILTSAFTGALMSVSDEASFIEMFCPDWKNNMIFISHMGEMNTALTHTKPKFMKKAIPYSDVDTTWICGTFKEGTATLINLLPLADGKFRVISSLVEMKVPQCEKLLGKATCGWFTPGKEVSQFLADYSSLGGTHHLDMMYGDMRKVAESFANAMGYEYFEI